MPRTPTKGWAKLTLGLSLLFAVGAFVYLWVIGRPLNGVALGLLVIGAGYWEYRRKLQDERTANRYEAEAEQHRNRRRK
ncbi:MAG: hypothetical protein ACOCQV_01615 [Halolamina sp.]